MNTGIQDVANLAWKLAAVARGADNHLLDSYEKERAPVGEALLRFTERGLKMATLSNPLLESARNALVPMISKLHPVQQTIVGFISETAIQYRSSSIVSDHKGDGDLRAGDRLPDVSVSSPSGQSTLLQDWTAANHLIIVLDGSDADISEIQARLPSAEVLPLSAVALDAEGRRILGTGKKLIVVRPDGYVGFRGPISDVPAQMDYARQEHLV
jgi:hypothetical protein